MSNQEQKLYRANFDLRAEMHSLKIFVEESNLALSAHRCPFVFEDLQKIWDRKDLGMIIQCREMAIRLSMADRVAACVSIERAIESYQEMLKLSLKARCAATKGI